MPDTSSAAPAGRMPVLFVGHGNPMNAIEDNAWSRAFRDLARALYDLVVHKATGILHYRNREPVSWFEFARAIAAGWDREVEVAAVGSAEFPRPAPRPAYSVLDVGRCERLLGRQVEPWIGGLWEYLWQLRQRRV